MSTTIKVGDTIPEAEFPTVFWSPELESGAACGSPTKINTKTWGRKEGEVKRVVVVAVPGAFTPTCHVNHIPDFVKRYKEFKDKGVDVVAVLAANDPFVMSGWGRINGAKDDVIFLTDPYAEWSKKLGATADLTDLGGLGLGFRTGRYAAIIENNQLKELLVEPNPGELKVSDAGSVLQTLSKLGW